MSREKQDEWKRTQLRIPQGQYDSVAAYAEQNNLSLNSAILDLVNKGLEYIEKFSANNIEDEDMVSDEIREHLKSIERLLIEKDFLKSL